MYFLTVPPHFLENTFDQKHISLSSVRRNFEGCEEGKEEKVLKIQHWDPSPPSPKIAKVHGSLEVKLRHVGLRANPPVAGGYVGLGPKLKKICNFEVKI